MHRSSLAFSTHLVGALLTIATIVTFATSAAAQPLSFVASYQSTPIQNATAVVLSDDGRHLYAAGDRRLAVLERGANGALTLTAAFELAEQRLGGDFIDLALAPDGKSLYAASDGRLAGQRPALGVFRRDPATGALEQLERHIGGSFGMADPAARLRVAVAPDGRHVYVLSRSKERLSIFARDAASGRLSFLDSLSGRGGRFGSETLAISTDGELVVVGGQPLLAGFRRNAANGRLTEIATLDDLRDPSDDVVARAAVALAFSPDGRHLYALAQTQDDTGDTDDQVVASFDRDPSTGAPRFLRAPSTAKLAAGTDLELSPDGKSLYAISAWPARGSTSSVAVFARTGSSGALEPLQAFTETTSEPGSLARAAAVSPDGRHFYVGSFERRPVTAFRRNRGSGRVAISGAQTRGVDGLGGASAIAVSAGGGNVYVGAREQAALSRFERRADGLAFGGVTFATDPGGEGLATLVALIASRDGGHLYALSGLDGTVAVFTRNPASGKPSFLQSLELPSATNGGAVLSPDDRDLYVLGSHGLTLVQRNAASFAVTQLDLGNATFSSGGSLALSPDGRHLYVISMKAPDVFGLNQMFVFERNASDGRLNLVRTIDLAAAPTSVLLGLQLVFDPEGRHGYLSAWLTTGSPALLVFRRDAGDGDLALVETVRRGIVDLGARGLLAMSADGTHLYAKASEKSLAVFERNAAQGRLELEQVLSEGNDGIRGVAGLSALAAASDGRLYGTSDDRSTLVVLRQDD